MKTIIVYYSLDGSTRKVAETIASEINADTLELKPVREINRKTMFLKMMDGGRQATFNVCPKLQEYSFKLSDYDRVIIGTPIWAGKIAPAIRTFLRDNELNYKVSAVFTLSGSGNNEKCLKALKKLCPSILNDANLLDTNDEKNEEINDKRIKNFVSRIKYN